MDYTKHIEAIENRIRRRTESLPRAINGDAPMEELKRIVGDINILKEIKDLLDDNNQNESTDQSMESMADNEIEFNSLPTNYQVYEAIKAKTGDTDLTWDMFWNRINASEDLNLELQKSGKASTCIKACDIYGLKAIINF